MNLEEIPTIDKKKCKFSFRQDFQNYSLNESHLQTQKQRIDYSVSLMWIEEQEERQKFNGQIDYTQSVQEAESCILKDLKVKGHLFKKGFKFFLKFRNERHIRLHQQKTNIKYESLCLQGVIIESKINLPEGYSYIPNQFDGFVIRDLSIGNEHGVIYWVSPVNVQEIDFSTGIKIGKDFIECNHKQLMKDVMVQFFQLSEQAKQKVSHGDKDIVLKKLKKQIEKKQNCRFLRYDQINKHWFVHIMMGSIK